MHSTFSDGRGTIEENVAAAERYGLTRMGCVDHVRRTSRWIDTYVTSIHRAQTLTKVILSAGVEAKIISTEGDLDVPDRLDGIDVVFAADHQFPSSTGPIAPAEVKRRLKAGELTADQFFVDLLTATTMVVRRNPGVVLAHLFSIVPKVGLDPSSIPLIKLDPLIDAARRHGACVEVDERWRCPTLQVTQLFAAAGVQIIPSSDSHRPEHIGRYSYVTTVFEGLRSC